MVEREPLSAEDDGSYVAFFAAGTVAEGSFRCADCGYGVVVANRLPTCPMCASTIWEEAAWSPARRSAPL